MRILKKREKSGSETGKVFGKRLKGAGRLERKEKSRRGGHGGMFLTAPSERGTFRAGAGNLLAAFLCAALLSGAGGFASMAEEALGPAADTEIADILQERGQAAGPAMETDGSGQPEGESQDSAAGQPEGESQDSAAGQPDGMVMSGGRLLDPSKPMIALTFDDGPYAPVGNRIMDCMEKYNGRGTFFVVGNRVNAYQDEIRRMQASGHEIGNHSYSHRYLQKLGAAEIRNEIESCNQAVAAAAGAAPALVRLPGGGYNATVLSNVHQPIILWNIDTRDWATRNADQTAEAVLGKVKDGDIVLMHELYGATADAAERIIPALSGQGFQLVTVSELIRFRGGAAPGTIYYSFPPV